MSSDPYVSTPVVTSSSQESTADRARLSAMVGAVRRGFRRVAKLFTGDTAPAVAAYRRLALQLEHDLGLEGKRSVLIVGADRSPLRRHAAANIATAMAEVLGKSVLLADADPDGGVTDLLGGSKSGSIQRTSHDKLAFLPYQGSLAHGDDVEKKVRDLESEYGFVVYSGGTVLTDLSALRLAPIVGQVLVLAFEHGTRKEDITLARETLKRCGAARIGVVLTRNVAAGS